MVIVLRRKLQSCREQREHCVRGRAAAFLYGRSGEANTQILNLRHTTATTRNQYSYKNCEWQKNRQDQILEPTKIFPKNVLHKDVLTSECSLSLTLRALRPSSALLILPSESMFLGMKVQHCSPNMEQTPPFSPKSMSSAILFWYAIREVAESCSLIASIATMVMFINLWTCNGYNWFYLHSCSVWWETMQLFWECSQKLPRSDRLLCIHLGLLVKYLWHQYKWGLDQGVLPGGL